MSVMSSVRRKANAFSVVKIEKRKKERQFNIFHNKLRHIVNGVIRNYIETQDISEQKNLRKYLHLHTDEFLANFEVPNYFKDAVEFLLNHYKKIKEEMGV